MVDLNLILTLIFGIGTIITAILICKHEQKKIHIIESKKEVKLDLQLMNQSLFDKPDLYEVVYGYKGRIPQIAKEPGKSDFLGLLCHLKFQIVNIGAITADNISLSIIYPKNIGIDNQEVEIKQYQLSNSTPQRVVEEIGNRIISKMFVPELNPGNAILYDETINIAYASETQFHVEGETQEGVPVEGTVQVSIQTPMKIVLTAKDYPSKQFQIFIRTIFVKNFEDLKNKINWEETQVMRQQLIANGFPKSIVESAYAPYMPGRAIVIMPDLKEKERIKKKGKAQVIFEENYEGSERFVIFPNK